MTKTIPVRSEIPVEHTWDTASMFPTPEDWDAEARWITEQLPGLQRFRGHLGDSASTLADWLDAVERIGRSLGKLTVYASMAYAVDTTNQSAVSRNDRARGVGARAMAAMSFAEPEMLAIGFETLRRWTQEEPRLAIFGHYFDRLQKRQAHIRSAEVEELLSQVMDPFRTAVAAHGVLADADLQFRPAASGEGSGETLEVAQGTINALLGSPDRAVRRSAWEAYADAHLSVKNTMAGLMAAGIKQDVLMARARRYGSSLEASVAANHIPVEVFHNLIKTFRANLPTWHRYWRIRRRALGYERLRVYDTRAQLTASKPRVPFAQSVEWISQGMAPLGADYVSVMRDGVLEQRWVDIYPNKGKRMGAFSTGAPGTHPFIFMSYHDDLLSMSTLAHELGHSMHSYYSRQTQPFVYARYGLFVAEVASNFNQALVRAHLLRANDDPEFQIAVIEEAMSNFHRYFFVMPTLARFELEIHERAERGEALTAESLINLMADLFGEGYGDEVVMDRERVGITWAQFHTHLYSNFYVYQYATGISGAHALAKRILSGEPGAVDNYLAFLKAGGSLYPLGALKLAGVDLASPEPVEAAFETFGQMVDRLGQLIERRQDPPRS
ncbi:MAG: oligoendopeptidase F [Chloroflexi bacterium]|nr:oligoendopeptidase F [Chloroflexota bacterium]